jgi:phosphatidylglycerol---prolipoprotein diacylglyceryl transferase
MYPILLKFGPLTLYTYGAMLVAAFSLALWAVRRIHQSLPEDLRPLTKDQLADLACVALLGGIAGARLFFIVLHLDFFAAEPQYILALWQGGLVWYGGMTGAILAGWAYTRIHRGPSLRLLDLFAPVIALAHAVGRLGCFLNGCCYGEITNAWYGVRIPGEPNPLVPVQLFEALGLVFLFIALRAMQRPDVLRRFPGRVFGVYLTGYAVLRFILERYRGDQLPIWNALTLQQIISVGVLLAGVLFVALSFRPAPARSS